jgi:hypothetical protein
MNRGRDRDLPDDLPDLEGVIETYPTTCPTTCPIWSSHRTRCAVLGRRCEAGRRFVLAGTDTPHVQFARLQQASPWLELGSVVFGPGASVAVAATSAVLGAGASVAVAGASTVLAAPSLDVAAKQEDVLFWPERIRPMSNLHGFSKRRRGWSEHQTRSQPISCQHEPSA